MKSQKDHWCPKVYFGVKKKKYLHKFLHTVIHSYQHLQKRFLDFRRWFDTQCFSLVMTSIKCSFVIRLYSGIQAFNILFSPNMFCLTLQLYDLLCISFGVFFFSMVPSSLGFFFVFFLICSSKCFPITPIFTRFSGYFKEGWFQIYPVLL